jgi:hypothetical protein
MDELRVDVRGCRHRPDATVYFLGADRLFAWIEFPVERAQMEFLTPVLGSSRSQFQYAQPYYLNLAPNYDATIAPRLMTKRGLQLPARGATSSTRFRARLARRPVQRPRYRRNAVGRRGSTQNLAPFCRALRVLEPQQGLRRHYFADSPIASG